MNKKTIAILVGALAVVAIVIISIFGSMAENSDKIKNVIAVVIDLEEQNPTTYKDDDGTTDIKIVTLSNSETPYQIIWHVLPSDATNKTVRFTSSSPSATVSTSGLVTFVENKNVVITLTSQDGTLKKAGIHFNFPGEHEGFLNVTIDDESVAFETEAQTTTLHQVSANSLILLEGSKYQFDVDETTIIELQTQNTSSTLTGIVLETNNAEEFVLKFTKDNGEQEDIIRNVSVKVVPYVQSFTHGSNYRSFLETMNEFLLPENEQTNDFMDKTQNVYLVGNANEFYFNVDMKRADLSAISQEEIELSFTAKNQSNEIVDLSTIATQNGNKLLFNETSLNNTYTITVVPKYNILNRTAISFTIKINSGVNVWTSTQLFENFKDLQTSEINIHKNMLVIARQNQLTEVTYNDEQEIRLKNYPNLNDGQDQLRQDSGSLFPRFIPSTYEGKNEITINGNYYFLNAESVPLYSYEETNGQAGALSWADELASVQEGLFALQDNRTVQNLDEDNYASATFKNLKIRANSAKGPIYTVDDQGNLSTEEENERITRQGSGLPVLMTRSGKIITENVTASNSIFTFWSAGQKAELTLTNTKTYDDWGGAVYGYKTSKITLTNVHFSRMGGAAISYEDASYTNETAEEYEDLVLTFNENVMIDNYLSGTEGWFVANGFTGEIPTLKTQIESTLNSAGKSMIKYDEEITAENFNYILQIVSSITTPLNQPAVDLQYTIKQMIGKDPVTNERIYRTTERRNGFKTNHPFTSLAQTGGTYLGSLGSYSNLESFKQLQHTIALVDGYLRNDSNITPLFTNFAPAGLTESIASIFGSLTGGAPISAYSSLPSDTQNMILLAISGYENQDLGVNIDEMVNEMLENYSAVDQATANGIKALAEANDSTKMGAFAIGLVFDEYKNTNDYLEILATLLLSDEMGSRQLALFVEFFDQAS